LQKRNNTPKKRILSLETIGNNRGNGSSSEEDRGGNFHLDHDDINVLKKWQSAIDARQFGLG
jgi:hypothetical protein